MSLAEHVREHVAACFPGLWIQTHEQDEAEAEIARLCRDQGWTLATWDIDRGLTHQGTAQRPGPEFTGVERGRRPDRPRARTGECREPFVLRACRVTE